MARADRDGEGEPFARTDAEFQMQDAAKVWLTATCTRTAGHGPSSIGLGVTADFSALASKESQQMGRLENAGWTLAPRNCIVVRGERSDQLRKYGKYPREPLLDHPFILASLLQAPLPASIVHMAWERERERERAFLRLHNISAFSSRLSYSERRDVKRDPIIAYQHAVSLGSAPFFGALSRHDTRKMRERGKHWRNIDRRST